MVFITAEIGTNHLGDIKIVKQLIDVAKIAGCDAIKFQKKDVDKIYSDEFLNSPLESPWGKTQRDMRMYREFSIKQIQEIDKYCKKKKILWYVSCWDIDSQLQMRRFKTKYNKIASAMLIHHKLLETIAKEKKYTFISTGMSTMKDIEKAVKIFRKYNCPFELLHCHSAYPMPLEEANLNMIPILKKKFRCKVGYSGHEKGMQITLAAVVLGVTSVERHITLDKYMYGSDQFISVNPMDLIKMCKIIRIIEKSMGDGKKTLREEERKVLNSLRRVDTL